MSEHEPPTSPNSGSDSEGKTSREVPSWLEKRLKREQRGIDYAAEVLGQLGEDTHEREEWVGKISRPRLPIKRIMPEVVEHFSLLGVVGAPSLTAREVGRMGTEILIDESMRESVVFYVLEKRRHLIDSPFIAPFVVVTKDHILDVAHEAEEKMINLDEIQRDQTTAGHERLSELKVDPDELEEAVMLDKQRRVIRALNHVLGEPVGMERLVARFAKQAQQDGTIPLNEVVGRTINWVHHLHDRHSRIDLLLLRQEEYLIHLLEEGRIERLRTLARRVLINSLDSIHLPEYNNGY